MENYNTDNSPEVSILLVEDDANQVYALKKALSDLQINIEIANSGEEAIKLLDRTKFLLVLLDIQLIGMTGIDVANKMRKNPKTKNTPIIFMTAYDKEDMSKLKYYELGAFDFIDKPINKDVLRLKIKMFLDFYKHEMEKETENLKLLNELKEKNQKLENTRLATLNMLEDANEARKIADKAKKELKGKVSQLIQSEKMNALGTLIAGVAHELNNPLMGVLNYTDYCLKHVPKNNKAYPVLKDLKEEAEKSADIVRGLLTFSRKEKTDLGKDYKTDLGKALQAVMKILNLKMKNKNINVHLPNTNGQINGNINLSHLQQILFNVLDNAIYAVENTNKKEIKIDIKKQVKYHIIQISDTGKGISTEESKNVFDPFFTTKPVGEGTGLGLSICKNILNDIGGDITYKSKPEKGTTFTIKIPVSNKN